MDDRQANQATDKSVGQSSETPKAVTPAQTSDSPFVSTGVPQKPKKSKKPFIIILITVVVLLLLGGGAFAYWTTLNSKPEKVLADALVNTANASINSTPTVTDGILTISGMLDKQEVKATIAFDSATTNQNGEMNAKIALQFGAMTLNVDGSVIALNDGTYYFKINNLRDVLKLTTGTSATAESAKSVVVVFEPLIGKLDGSWVKIAPNDLQQFGANTDQVDDCTSAVEGLQISKQDSKEIKKIFKANQFATVSETLPSESINGQNSFHYKLQFNEAAASEFTNQVTALPSLSGLKACSDPIAKTVQSTKGQNNGPQPTVELWVSKKSHDPTRLKVTYENGSVNAVLDTSVTLNAKDVTVAAPEGAIPVTELKKDFETVMTNLLIGAAISPRTQ